MYVNKVLATLLLFGFILTNCTPTENSTSSENSDTEEVAEAPSMEELAARGAYLVEIMGCNDCHSPKVITDQGPAPDPKRLLSGHPAEEQLADLADPSVLKDYAIFNMGLTAAVGPWGTTFAANLTPDDTGIGTWTFEQFGKALREGKSKGLDGARSLLPPMPSQNFRNLADEDLRAIWAYLRSLPPVQNVVPNPIPPAS